MSGRNGWHHGGFYLLEHPCQALAFQGHHAWCMWLSWVILCYAWLWFHALISPEEAKNGTGNTCVSVHTCMLNIWMSYHRVFSCISWHYDGLYIAAVFFPGSPHVMQLLSFYSPISQEEPVMRRATLGFAYVYVEYMNEWLLGHLVVTVGIIVASTAYCMRGSSVIITIFLSKSQEMANNRMAIHTKT